MTLTGCMQRFKLFLIFILIPWLALASEKPQWSFDGLRVLEESSEGRLTPPMVIWWNVGLNADGIFPDTRILEASIKSMIHPKVDVLAFGEFERPSLSYHLLKEIRKMFPYERSIQNYRHSSQTHSEIRVFSKWPLLRKYRSELKWTPDSELALIEMLENYGISDSPSSAEVESYLERKLEIFEVLRPDNQKFYLAPVHLNNPWAFLKNQNQEPAGYLEKILEVITSDNNPLVHQLEDLNMKINSFFKASDKTKPVILIGDFNLPRSPLPVGTQNSIMSYFIKVLHKLSPESVVSRGFQILREAGFQEFVPSETKSFPEVTEGEIFPFELQIDHALSLSSRELEVLRAGFLHQIGPGGENLPIGSDHRPLLIQFKIN